MFKSLTLIALLVPTLALAAAEVGKPAPAFELKDSNGKTHKLADLTAKHEIVVLEWLNYDCPFVKKHYNSKNMQNLQKSYTGKGVEWFSVISSAAGKQGNFPPAKINQLSKEKGAHPTAILLDEAGTVGKAYGAKTTPHMFVIGKDGLIAYAGGIDDKPSTDVEDVSTAKNLVAAALDETLAGKPVTVKSAPPYGCSIKY
jgi:peroxiredoxin